MFAFDTSNPTAIFVTILVLLTALGLIISVHEAAHALVANRLGDPTARLLGRISLNPLVHIDPIGTVIIPLVLMIIGAPVFGWAKPTPINPLNFVHPRRDSALVALAGPGSNFLLAAILSIIFRIFPNQIVFQLISINLVLAIFNLIPLPPLDGYKIVLGFLPKNAAIRYSLLENLGPFVLIIILLLFFQFFLPIVSLVLSYLLRIFTGPAF